MGTYVTKTSGIGGNIKKTVDDFVVEEVLVDGSKAYVEKSVSKNSVLGSTQIKQEYLLSVLVKRNWDTFIALKNVARQLGKDQEDIRIAGIKDAKAVTAQYVTIKHSTIEETFNIKMKDIELRPVGYLRHELSAYYLLGNNFRVRVTNVHYSESSIRKRIVETSKELERLGGIPNFFGHQRFGTTRPITHKVGKALLKGNFGEATMIFLAEASVNEHPSSRKARRTLQTTQNYNQALQNFPKQLRYERLMLSHLTEAQDDFTGAFKKLPMKLQTLFVQAYQSYLFNRFLTARIERGIPLNKAEIGDWVVRLERSGLPLVNTARTVTLENFSEFEALLKIGKMRIALPLVGRFSRIPQSEMGDEEKKILAEEQISPENFKLRDFPEAAARGGLRAINAPVRDFRVLGISSGEVSMSFNLLRGCYATVFLREILKPKSPILSGF